MSRRNPARFRRRPPRERLLQAVPAGPAGAPAAQEALESAVAAAREAATVAHSAATAVGTAAGRADDAQPRTESEIVQAAAAVVEDAAAVVEEAANVVRDTAAVWPDVERRRRPRQSHARDAVVGFLHLAVYFTLALLVLAAGILAIWSFLERQSLVVAPVSLPPVTLVTADPQSPIVAAWVRLLTESEASVTVIPAEHFEPVARGVVFIVELPQVPPRTAAAIARFRENGGGVIVAGPPPPMPLGAAGLVSDPGVSDESMTFAETASPLLARSAPGAHIPARPGPVALLRESPRMQVDARWSTSARAAIVHVEDGRSRLIWVGFDPTSMADEGLVKLLLRTGLRWLDGQPISEGGVGKETETAALTPAERAAARSAGFVFSAERLRSGSAIVKMVNRGARPIAAPSVEVWLPPGATGASAGGDLFMRRGVTVNAVPGQRACIVSVESLAPHEQRLVKLRIE